MAKTKRASKKKAGPRKSSSKKSAGKKAAPPKKKAKKSSPAKKSSLKRSARAGNFKSTSSLESVALVDTATDVKQRIITASPLTGIGVGDLEDDMLLKENLNYLPDNFNILEISLERYVNDRASSKHVTSGDISNNKTVGKIVKMVKTKLNES